MKTINGIVTKDVVEKYINGKGGSHKLALLAKYQTGNILFVGDSVIAGQGADDDGGLPINNCLSGLLRTAITDSGLNAGQGYQGLWERSSYYHATWSANWTVVSTGGFGIGGTSLVSNIVDETVSFGFTGTNINLMFACNFHPSYAGGQIDVAIDGGGAVRVDLTSNPMHTYTVTGLTNTAHTIIITVAVIGADEYVMFDGWYVDNDIMVMNVGLAGSDSTQYVGSGSVFEYPFLDTLQPVLTIIGLGANDFNNSVAVATYQTNLTVIVTKAQAYGDVVLLDYMIDYSEDQRLAYRQAMQAVATARSCTYVDCLLGNDSTAAIAAGYIADGHPTNTGYALMYAELEKVLFN